MVGFLEIYGTSIGAWHWAATAPDTPLPAGNPPSGIAGVYVLFDIAAIALAPRLLSAVDRVRELAEDRLARTERRQHALGDGLAGEADLLAEQGRLAVRDVAVGQTDTQDAGALGAVGEGVLGVLEHGRAEAARQHVLLDRHQQVVIGGEPLDQLAVERLGEAAVGDGRLQALARGGSPRRRSATWTP